MKKNESKLEIRRLSKSYHTIGYTSTVIKRLDMDVNKNDFCSIMGPSGSGKTTLLNLIAGIDSADDGKICIEENDITDFTNEEMSSFRRNNIGVVFQDFNLIDGLTVKENIILPLDLENMTEIEIEEKVTNVTEKVGISHLLNKQVYEISGGEKQRVAICRAIINEPLLLLADEPTGNLDRKSAKEVLSCLKELNENNGTTIIMVTHDPLSASYSKSVLLFRDGKIVDSIEREQYRDSFYQEIVSGMQR